MSPTPNERIEFRAERQSSRFHDPRRNFALAEAEHEVRYDPLTGDTARICHFTIDKAPPVDFADAIERTQADCPFCPERIDRVTPRFEEALVPGGRVQRGEAVVLPNLFPYDDFSAITVVSGHHSLPIADMPAKVIVDALGASLDFLRLVDARIADGPTPSYALVTWNFMPPAGGSQLHPHLQVIHTTHPTNRERRRFRAEEAWSGHYGSPYIADLLELERERGERWIGESGSVSWFAPYLPTGMLGDCTAVFPERASVTELGEEDLIDFATGLRHALAGFAEMGFQSFNLVLTGDATGSLPTRRWVSASIVPRFYVNPVMRSCDVAYMQLCLDENFAMVYPEETAERLRRFWK